MKNFRYLLLSTAAAWISVTIGARGLSAAEAVTEKDLLSLSLTGVQFREGGQGITLAGVPALPIASLKGFAGEAALGWRPALSPWQFGIHARSGHTKARHKRTQSSHSTGSTSTSGGGSTSSGSGYGTTTTTGGGGGGSTTTDAFQPGEYHETRKTSRRASHMMVDFTAQRDVGFGTTPWGDPVLSLGGRIRFARLSDVTRDEQHTLVTYMHGIGVQFEQTVADSYRRRFTGAGPMLGFSGSLPLMGGLTLDGSAEAGVLFGRFVENYSNVVDGANADSARLGKARAALALSGSLGAAYHFSQDFSLSAGYRFDATYGAFASTGVMVDETADRNQQMNGPYLSLKYNF